MANRLHTHKGYESNGELKPHPITQHHRDPQVQKWHILSFGKQPKKTEKKNPLNTRQPVEWRPEAVVRTAPVVDSLVQGITVENGVLCVRVESLASHIRGVRLSFSRVEGRYKRNVTLEIPR